MGKRGKPTLPKSVDWPDETVSWFEAWRESPRTDGWDKQQWNYLIETAVVHAEVFASGNFGMLGELRAREAYMGVTFDQKPPKTDKAPVTPLEVIRAKYKGRGAASAG